MLGLRVLDGLADRIQGHIVPVTLVAIVRVQESEHPVIIPQYCVGGSMTMEPFSQPFMSVAVDRTVEFCLYVRLPDGITPRVYSASTLPLPSHIGVGELEELERKCVEMTLAGEPQVVNLRMKENSLPDDLPVQAYNQLVLHNH